MNKGSNSGAAKSKKDDKASTRATKKKKIGETRRESESVSVSKLNSSHSLVKIRHPNKRSKRMVQGKVFPFLKPSSSIKLLSIVIFSSFVI